jgi:hypothetical protein
VEKKQKRSSSQPPGKAAGLAIIYFPKVSNFKSRPFPSLVKPGRGIPRRGDSRNSPPRKIPLDNELKLVVYNQLVSTGSLHRENENTIPW